MLCFWATAPSLFRDLAAVSCSFHSFSFAFRPAHPNITFERTNLPYSPTPSLPLAPLAPSLPSNLRLSCSVVRVGIENAEARRQRNETGQKCAGSRVHELTNQHTSTEAYTAAPLQSRLRAVWLYTSRLTECVPRGLLFRLINYLG